MNRVGIMIALIGHDCTYYDDYTGNSQGRAYVGVTHGLLPDAPYQP